MRRHYYRTPLGVAPVDVRRAMLAGMPPGCPQPSVWWMHPAEAALHRRMHRPPGLLVPLRTHDLGPVLVADRQSPTGVRDVRVPPVDAFGRRLIPGSVLLHDGRPVKHNAGCCGAVYRPAIGNYEYFADVPIAKHRLVADHHRLFSAKPWEELWHHRNAKNRKKPPIPPAPWEIAEAEEEIAKKATKEAKVERDRAMAEANNNRENNGADAIKKNHAAERGVGRGKIGTGGRKSKSTFNLRSAQSGVRKLGYMAAKLAAGSACGPSQARRIGYGGQRPDRGQERRAGGDAREPHGLPNVRRSRTEHQRYQADVIMPANPGGGGGDDDGDCVVRANRRATNVRSYRDERRTAERRDPARRTDGPFVADGYAEQQAGAQYCAPGVAGQGGGGHARAGLPRTDGGHSVHTMFSDGSTVSSAGAGSMEEISNIAVERAAAAGHGRHEHGGSGSDDDDGGCYYPHSYHGSAAPTSTTTSTVTGPTGAAAVEGALTALRCPYSGCGRQYSDAEGLTRHLARTRRHDVLVCCGSVFLTPAALWRHARDTRRAQCATRAQFALQRAPR